MDAAKLAAFLCGDTGQELREIYGVDLAAGTRLPLIQVSNATALHCLYRLAGADHGRDGLRGDQHQRGDGERDREAGRGGGPAVRGLGRAGPRADHSSPTRRHGCNWHGRNGMVRQRKLGLVMLRFHLGWLEYS